MTQAYSNPDRERDDHTLPDIEIFQLTALEVAERDDDLIHQYLKRPQFRLATMNSRVRGQLLDAIIEENGITGGWFWWSCFPGCLPDSEPFGPFASFAAAKADAQEDWS